ncbi:MAG TPA: asparaginase [Roseomonas sp.]|jgi:L-asparaginase
MTRKKVVLIGTGGTIASMGTGPFDIQDYGARGLLLDATALVARVPELAELAEVVPVPFRAVPSTQLGYADWRELHRIIHQQAAEDDGIAGFVITHGTSSMEETAYFLSLTLKVRQPVVLTGAQRPATAISGDGPINIANAVRVAASEEARGMGALIVMNDEIQAARDVTKTSTFRMQTFRTADFGVLGQADGDRIVFYRRPVRRAGPDTEFDVTGLQALPRVDVAYVHCDADGAAVDAFVAAGAKGIVTAGFAPGFVTPSMVTALEAARARGVVVAMGCRAGSGRVFRTSKIAKSDFIVADNLTPQKARILLALALTKTTDQAEITRMFETY